MFGSGLVLGAMNGLYAAGIGAFVHADEYGVAAAMFAFWLFQAIDSIWLLVLRRK